MIKVLEVTISNSMDRFWYVWYEQNMQYINGHMHQRLHSQFMLDLCKLIGETASDDLIRGEVISK
jgi:hypothetical protein